MANHNREIHIDGNILNNQQDVDHYFDSIAPKCSPDDVDAELNPIVHIHVNEGEIAYRRTTGLGQPFPDRTSASIYNELMADVNGDATECGIQLFPGKGVFVFPTTMDAIQAINRLINPNFNHGWLLAANWIGRPNAIDIYCTEAIKKGNPKTTRIHAAFFGN